MIIYLAGKSLYVIISIFLTQRKGVSWAEAIKLNTFLLTEFRNNLIKTLNEQERGQNIRSHPEIELDEVH